MPGFLGLLPFRTIDLVLLADLVLAFVLFSVVQSMLQTEATNVPLPLDREEIRFAAACSALPLVLRDRWPLAAWRLAAVLVPWGIITRLQAVETPYSADTVIMYLLVLYAVAVRCERHITIGAWLVSVAGVWWLESQLDQTGVIAIGGGLVTAAVLLGYNVRARRTAVRLLAEEERRSEQALAGQAVLEERARIARELHDIVAHHMSVIAIQAEAVPLKARGEARLLEEGLAEIRTLSLTAMTEMRRVLGVLRDADGARDTAPQPGLGRLEELVATARSAGLTVTLKPGGDLTGLPAAVSLSAYRIVQESLSNAMRHAPGSAVSVRITRTADELHLHVADDGGRRSPEGPGRAEAPRHAGHGLLGMRERVSMLGGKLWAGPAGGGFAVTAVLPLPEDL
ncbi:two-component system sensor histidine kinase [Planomonospora sphaerica]|uniref:histidine kinase n=1 Tax=Planomonospora sphaerica TaxID=161355 RepID=A0A171B1P1_9ACTN|nr:two-component system sensor histidine kinase [Planomonospora sphaerica]